MQICKRSMVRQNVLGARIFCVLAIFLAFGITESFADTVTFYTTSTADYSHWQVAANLNQSNSTNQDTLFATFPNIFSSTFTGATAETGARTNWIANNSTGSNGGVGHYAFFVFRETFDLTGYDPTTANLQFQWAADDSGQGILDRGNWTPKYILNPADPLLRTSLINGVWSTGETYSLGPTTTISSGFVSGLNTIYFFVEGNGQTDGFSLMNASLTANAGTPGTPGTPVPEPSTMLLLGSGLAGLVGYGRRRMKK